MSDLTPFQLSLRFKYVTPVIMELFYDPNFSNSNFTLSEEESKHCIQVLRHKAGDQVKVINGTGLLFIGIIIEAHPKRCKIEITEKQEFTPQPFHLHIGIAPTKNIDRFEWFIEKATEIGIHEITPLLCKHSERQQLRNDRIEKIIVSAAKQSLKFNIPVLNPLTPYQTFLNQTHEGQNFIAHCVNSEKLLLKNAYSINSNVTILIGPEGDFSKDEIENAINRKFTPISLGESRLRTETAGIVACHTIQLLNE
jgi:16S rRNA (uracil1498-N3)-methyltransferase